MFGSDSRAPDLAAETSPQETLEEGVQTVFLAPAVAGNSDEDIAPH